MDSRIPGFYVLALFPPTVFASEMMLGVDMFCGVPVSHLLLVPALDYAFGRYRSSHAPEDQDWLISVPYLYGIGYALVLFLFLVQLSRGESAGLWVVSGALSLGLIGGNAILASHELVHKRFWVHRVFGHALLILTNYPHFMIWHVAGHHRLAATQQDNSTAFRGEALPRYLLRTIPACALSALRREEARGRVGIRNPVLRLWAIQVVTYIAMALSLGWGAVTVFVAQGIVAVLLLETVSYIQHYGLLRSLSEDGKRGAFGPDHAWDSRFIASNYYLLDLPLHAHHHLHPSDFFWHARTNRRALELPYSYSWCMVLAAMPPLWFRLIHPILDREEPPGPSCVGS